MLRLWSHSSPRDDRPSPDQEEFIDLDPDLLDFDPVKEWLVDPYPDLAPMEAAAEPQATNPDGPNPETAGSAVPGELLGSPIDDKMEKVSLVEISGLPDGPGAGVGAARSNGDGLPAVGVSGVEAVKGDGVSDVCSVSDPIKVAHESEEEEDSSESETDESEGLETSSSLSDESSSSSSEEEVDGDGGDDKGRSKGGEMDEMLDLEEGEIRDLVQEEVVMCSDEDEEVVKEPIRSKHEIVDLPLVPQVEVFLEPRHQTLPVGVISSILGTRVIVEGSENHNPLSEGSILWITEIRSPLGLVDEIFGPVKSPYYVVRYNSDKEVPAGISMGTAVSFVMEFANYILNDKDIYKKGYDASGENDEEASDEVEFSDDEKEAEYRRSLRQLKRASNDTRHGKQETAFDKRTNFKGAPSNATRHGNHVSTMDKRTNFKGGPGNGRWHGNQESGIDKNRTNFKGPPSNDRWHGDRESAIDMKSRLKGGPNQKCMQPSVSCAPPAMGQSLPNVPGSLQAPSVIANSGCNYSVESGNAFGSAPLTPVAIPQAAQLGTCLSDPSQQLLLQQINALLTLGFPPQQLHMGIQGGYPMNLLPIPQVGNMTYHPQHQNQVFSGFPNAVPCQQQFMPNLGAPANMPWLGGPQNLSIGAAGQSNDGQAPFGCSNVHDQGASGSCNAQNYGQPPQAIDQGGMRPMQFNHPLVPHDQGGMRPPMQFNPPIGPTSLGAAAGQSGVGRAPFGCSNVPDQGSSGSCNAESLRQHPSVINQGGIRPPMQFNSSMVPRSLGPAGQSSIGRATFGCSNTQEQGASGSSNAQSYLQPRLSIDQGGMRRPMQFNPGQPSAGQTPFGGGDMQEQGSSDSCNAQSYGQPPPATDQGGMHPMQFNSARSSFRGRNPHQRGGRRFFGRGGRPQHG